MKIAILDAKTLGSDINLEPIKRLGEVMVYDLTTAEQVIDRVKDVDVIVTNKVILGERELEQAQALKLIALFATGYNNIDLDYAKKRGIGVANVAGYSTKSVAQHTFAMLFQLLEHLGFYDRYVKTKAYATSETFAYIEKPFYQIDGKVWGIIGMGAIGQEVARMAEAFGAKVVYYSTSGKNTQASYEKVSLETLLEKSHIVSIHAPLNEMTQNLIGYEEMRQMKKEAILMNLGRGSIINEEDLVRALKEDLIRGAALDVLQEEPIASTHPLYEVDEAKWLVTPHIAWASVEARRTLVEEVAGNIQACFKGESRNRLV